MAGVPPWLKDKRVQLGIVAAAGLGIFIAIRRGGGASLGGGGDSGTPLQPAQFDSSGTDLYNALQSISQGWTNDLRALTDQLRDSGQLDPAPSGGTGADPFGRYKVPVGTQPRPWAGDDPTGGGIIRPRPRTVPRPTPLPPRSPTIPRK